MLTDCEERHKNCLRHIHLQHSCRLAALPGYHNIEEDWLSPSSAVPLCPSRAAKHEVKQQACPPLLQRVTWTSGPAHRKWHKQAGPREEGHQWRWWATLWMLLDMCGCSSEEGGEGGREGSGRRGWGGGGGGDEGGCCGGKQEKCAHDCIIRLI